MQESPADNKRWKRESQGPNTTVKTSNKVDIQPKVIKKDKEGHYLLITGKVGQEKLSILNIYALNTRAPIFIKETLLKLKNTLYPTQK